MRTQDGVTGTETPVFLIWVASSIELALHQLLERKVKRDERADLGKAAMFAQALFPEQPLRKHLVSFDWGGNSTDWLNSQEAKWQWSVHRIAATDNHPKQLDLQDLVVSLLDELASIPGDLLLACNDDYGNGEVSQRLGQLRDPRNGHVRRVALLNLEPTSDFAGAQFERFDLVDIGVVAERVHELAESRPQLTGCGASRDQPHDDDRTAEPTTLLGRVSRIGNETARAVRKVAARGTSPADGQPAGSVTLPVQDFVDLIRRNGQRS